MAYTSHQLGNTTHTLCGGLVLQVVGSALRESKHISHTLDNSLTVSVDKPLSPVLSRLGQQVSPGVTPAEGRSCQDELTHEAPNGVTKTASQVAFLGTTYTSAGSGNRGSETKALGCWTATSTPEMRVSGLRLGQR